MGSSRFRAAVVLWLIVPMAGCTSPSDSPAPGDEGIVVVDSPFNRTLAGDARPHLHDYWGGRHTLTIADVDIAAGGYVWLGGTPISVATHRPEPGKVVPQGAGWVNVTVGWDDEDAGRVPPNQYTNPQLFVKSASDNGVVLRANLTSNPQTVSIPIGAAQADLPHQVLSAWQFDLFLSPSVTGAGGVGQPMAAFTGTTHFLVTADHTLDIPLYPGHPDQWQNRTDILLTKGGGELVYDGDPTAGWRCYGGCPVIHHPDDKVVVPATAASVIVKLGLSGMSPTKLGLLYHDASARDWVKLAPTEDTPTMRTYVIPVGNGGDGPYATQSQWEFAPYPEAPVEYGYMYDTYTFEAAAKKGI